MNPPLLEVSLELHFDPVILSPEPSGHFGSTDIFFTEDSLLLKNFAGISYPGLREEWLQILRPVQTQIPIFNRISLAYLNEIPLQDLQDFRNYLNINIQLPEGLNDRFEFFRTEFTLKYPLAEIKVWLQPDWDEHLDGYCIQLNLESRNTGTIDSRILFQRLQELHEELKDVFRQVLSEDYLSQLPQ